MLEAGGDVGGCWRVWGESWGWTLWGGGDEMWCVGGWGVWEAGGGMRCGGRMGGWGEFWLRWDVEWWRLMDGWRNGWGGWRE